MPTKWDIVAEFSRDELWQIVDDYELDVEDRRKLDDMQEVVERLSRSDLRTILATFDRDRLKQICRHLDLDDSGKLKSDIIDRLIKPPAIDDDDDAFTAAPAGTTVPPGKNMPLLNLLMLDELLDIIDQYGILVEKSTSERSRSSGRSTADKHAVAYSASKVIEGKTQGVVLCLECR